MKNVIGASAKVPPEKYILPPVFTEEKFTFQINMSALFSKDAIPTSFIINIDQTPLSYVNTGKYMFSYKGAKNIPIKDMDDKRQITVTFAVSCTGKFLPIQLIYAGKTE